jgi:hypothetical protein
MYVRVQNGYELGELHDVALSSPTNGQVLTYNSSTDLWENQTPTTSVSKSILNQNHGGVAINAVTTTYGGWSGATTFVILASEFSRNTIIPLNGTINNWAVNVNAQPASGSLVFTLRVNTVDTSMTITIAAGSATNKYYNNSSNISVVKGDLITFKVVNNASAANALVGNSIMYEV